MWRSLVLVLGLIGTPLVGQPAAGVPVAEEVSAPDRMAGRWFSQFGYLDLKIEDGVVTGTYSCCEGRIDGILKGPEHIEFSWKDPIYGEGWGNFYLRDEGHRLVGGWGRAQDFASAGPWNAVRVEEPEDAAQHFRVTTSSPRMGSLDGGAALTLTGGTVKGVLRGKYALEANGKPYHNEVYLRLEGTVTPGEMTLQWTEPIDGTQGRFTLERRTEGWSGEWHPAPGEAAAPFVLTPVPES